MFEKRTYSPQYLLTGCNFIFSAQIEFLFSAWNAGSVRVKISVISVNYSNGMKAYKCFPCWGACAGFWPFILF